MNARYRCPWCGSSTSEYRSVIIAHIVNQHQAAVLVDLKRAKHPGIRKEAIAP